MIGSTPSATFSLEIQLAPDLDDAPLPRILQGELEACLMALTQTLPEISAQPLSRDICLRLCDEAESQALNRDYRERDKPTNVLSFGVQELEAPQHFRSIEHHQQFWKVSVTARRGFCVDLVGSVQSRSSVVGEEQGVDVAEFDEGDR